MKKAVLLLVTCAGIMQAQAQTNPDTKRMKANRAMINRVLRAQQPHTAQKPTGTQYRVKAQAAQATGGTIDSLTFKYSSTRGSRYDYDNRGWGYNEYFDSYYAPHPILPFGSNPLNLLADSICYYEEDTLTDIETATYRPDNKIINATSVYPDPTGDYYARQANTYNAQGYIILSYIMEGTPPALDTTAMQTTTYNAAFTQVVADSSFERNGSSYDLSEAMRYHYGATGKLDSIEIYSFDNGPFQRTQTVVFDYYNDGKLRKSSATVYNDTGAVIFGSIDSFGYTTGINYTTYWDTYIFSSFSSAPFGERWVKYPGSNGLPDSSIRYSLNSGNWQEADRIYYSYTSFNAPQRLTFIENGTESGQYRFYYEDYDDGVNSINPLAQNKDFNLYPNPFRNDLYIDWKGKQSKVAVSLYNMIGQEVYRSTLSLRNGKNTLSIPGINAGNYMLLLQDVDGKTWSSKIVKQ